MDCTAVQLTQNAGYEFEYIPRLKNNFFEFYGINGWGQRICEPDLKKYEPNLSKT